MNAKPNDNEIVKALRNCGGGPEGMKITRAAADLIEALLSQLAAKDAEIERLSQLAMMREGEIGDRDREIERLREAQRWTDTEYDTPDIGQAVLLYMPDKETDNIRAGEYMGEGDYRIGNKLYRGMEIDAWLPLPAAPCGKDGEGE